jgi:hypothetical protein
MFAGFLPIILRMYRGAAHAVALQDVKTFIFRSLLAVALAQAMWMEAMPAALTQKVQVSTLAEAQALEAQGGQIVADYGGFKLYAVDANTTNLPSSAEGRNAYNSILLNAGQIDTSRPAAQARRATVGEFAGKRLHLIQFAGPIQPAWRTELLQAGVEVVNYIPYNAYLVYGDAASVARAQKLAATAPHIQWDGAYGVEYKIHPNARTTDAAGRAREIGTDRFAIQLMADAAPNAATLRLIDQWKLAAVERRRSISHFVDVVVRLPAAALAQIAARPDVISIQTLSPPRKVGERQDQIVAGNLSGNAPSGPGYLAWLAGKGFTQAQFTASGFVVDVTDSGIDNGTTSPNHFGLYANGDRPGTSRVAYNILQGHPNSGSTLAGCDGHGNLNAHIVMGYDDGAGFPFADSSGYHYGLGTCPFATAGSSVIFDPDNSTSPDDISVLSTAYAHAARISNNSWGDSNPHDDGTYDMDCFEYDSLVRDAQPTGAPYAAPGNQEMVVVFAAGNDGPATVTISPPGTAKNVITVGAAQNVQPFGGADGSGVGNSGADDANSVIDFSGRGPCADGRHKPDLVAPGTHVSGGAPQDANPGPDGTALPCFLQDGSGVSGGVGTNMGINLFYPNKQQFYTASSGTSHSTPCVTGGCALVRQYFINNSNAPPSPAMTKAFLINSARYMTGTGANDTLWSDSQGMGEMDLGMAFDGTPRILRDELSTDLFTASGQTRVFAGVVGDSTKPFRVTLAWTDAPGSTSGASYNNDLDLTVNLGGVVYKGNFFNRSNSIPGGTADSIDNVESVFLPAGVSGRFTVTVTAANINSVGVPNGANALNQDFALVVYNAGAAATVAPAGYALSGAQPCTNGSINAGERVTVNFAVQNVGSSATTNMVGTLLAYLLERDQTAPGVFGTAGELESLLAANQIAFPSGPVSFGAVAAGATASNTFSFTADAACGDTITAVLQLQDGTTDLGTVSYAIPLGQGSSVTNSTTVQNFDGQPSGPLPSGWTSTNSVSGLMVWTVVTSAFDTAPNAAFCPDSANRGEVYLYSPIWTLSNAPNQLIFRNDYNLEQNYDGGVLEIAVGDAAISSASFVDILAAGARFQSNGYNGTITGQGETTSMQDPLTGRQAWTGDSGGFVTTVVNLPDAAGGTNIQLRWALGTDQANANTNVAGWWIDTVSISQPSYDCTNCPVTNPAAATIVFPTNLYQFATILPDVVVTGQAPEGSTVVISNNGASNQTVLADGNGIYSALTTLSFGTNVLTAAANGSNASAPISILIELAPPTLEVPAVANPTVAVSGTGAPGATVNLYLGTTAGGAPLQSFMVDASGNYAGTVTLPLGTATLVATESADGQTSTNTAPSTVSVVPLAPPTITTPVSGLVMNRPTLVVTGKGVAGCIVTISNVADGLTTALGQTTVNHAGRFSLVIKPPNGTNVLFAVEEQNSITSPASKLVEVINYLTPEILVQPVSQTNFMKGSVTFTTEVVGAAPLHLFWEKNGVKIPGATGPNLTLANLKTNNEAGYNLVASNAYGEVQSAVVGLTLVPTNPFPALAGTYYGLFAEPTAEFDSSGQIVLTLTSLGRFSARVSVGGGTYAYAGALSAVGWGSNLVARPAGLPPLTVVLDLNVTNGSNQISGTVNAGTNWTASLQANRAVFSRTNPCPYAGTYTMVFVNTNSGQTSPGGDGWGTARISTAGLVSLAGFLPDNTAFAPPAVSLSRAGAWPFYAGLNGRFGSISGWIQFTNKGPSLANPASNAPCHFAGSTINWFRTSADGRAYTNGFTNLLEAVGSSFAAAESAPYLGGANWQALVEGGNLPTAETNAVMGMANGKFAAGGGNISGLNLRLAPAKGLIHGNFADPAATAPALIQGVVFQDQTNAAGYFVSGTNAGLFLLTPP